MTNAYKLYLFRKVLVSILLEKNFLFFRKRGLVFGF